MRRTYGLYKHTYVRVFIPRSELFSVILKLWATGQIIWVCMGGMRGASSFIHIRVAYEKCGFRYGGHDQMNGVHSLKCGYGLL